MCFAQPAVKVLSEMVLLSQTYWRESAPARMKFRKFLGCSVVAYEAGFTYCV